MSEGFSIHALGNRGILRGVQCVCGQWWPDFQRHGVSNEFITECCGSIYLYSATVSGHSSFTTLSLLKDNTEGNAPALPTSANPEVCPP